MAVSVYVSLTLLCFAARATGQHRQTLTVRALPLATPGGEADGRLLPASRCVAAQRVPPTHAPKPCARLPGALRSVASALLLLISGRLGSTALTVTCAGKESDVNELKREQDGWPPSLPTQPRPAHGSPLQSPPVTSRRRHTPGPSLALPRRRLQFFLGCLSVFDYCQMYFGREQDEHFIVIHVARCVCG